MYSPQSRQNMKRATRLAGVVLGLLCFTFTPSQAQQEVPAAIGQEIIPPDEPAEIERIVADQKFVQDHLDKKQTPVPRGQHGKQHGTVRAEFIVEPDLPEQFKYGLFSEPHTYNAWIRFSNGRKEDDRKADSHGMAVKIVGVKGERAMQNEDANTQDFVLIDNPIFFVKNVSDYVPLMEDFRKMAAGNFFQKSVTGLKFLLSPDYKFRLLRKMASKKPDSPLSIQYWSTTPSKMGPSAMKFSVRPVPEETPTPTNSNSKDKLRNAMSAHLHEREARFEYLVQLQTDPIGTPIEDPTVEWDEKTSPFVKVATIVIPVQSFESAEQMKFGEDLSFTPWHSLADIRPLGGINRTRLKVYQVISAGRHELNGVDMEEPAQ